MRQAGEVTYADAHKGRKNEGVIEFVSYSDMKRALEKLDGTEVNGRKIRLVEDKPGSRRRRSYSRSRSHSRYCCCKFINEHIDNPFLFSSWGLSTVVLCGLGDSELRPELLFVKLVNSCMSTSGSKVPSLPKASLTFHVSSHIPQPIPLLGAHSTTAPCYSPRCPSL